MKLKSLIYSNRIQELFMVLGAHGAVSPLSPRTINISEIGRVLISIYKGNFEPILMGVSPKALLTEEGKMSEEGKDRKNTGRVVKPTDQF